MQEREGEREKKNEKEIEIESVCVRIRACTIKRFTGVINCIGVVIWSVCHCQSIPL
jgi:hypothetical protein